MVAKPLETLPVDENDPMSTKLLDPNILRNIIFKYMKEPSALLNVLLEISTSALKPRLIIIDYLHTFFSDLDPSANEKNDFYNEFIRKHMLIVATVQNSVDVLTKHFGTECSSVICLNPSAHKAYDRFEQTIVDLYYYKKYSVFSTSTELIKSFNFNK